MGEQYDATHPVMETAWRGNNVWGLREKKELCGVAE
jgi:hypothetical protein